MYKRQGPDALSNIQNLVTNDCGGMADGQVKYSPMCNERGGVVDDLMVYRMGPEEYLLVVNAANHEKDAQWIQARLEGCLLYTSRRQVVAIGGGEGCNGPAAHPTIEAQE